MMILAPPPAPPGPTKPCLAGKKRPQPEPEMEDYQCSICTGLLVQPVVAPCGHEFCGHCLEAWRNKCRNNETRCPLCRQTVYTPSKPSLGVSRVLDKAIRTLFPCQHQARLTEVQEEAAAATAALAQEMEAHVACITQSLRAAASRTLGHLTSISSAAAAYDHQGQEHHVTLSPPRSSSAAGAGSSRFFSTRPTWEAVAAVQGSVPGNIAPAAPAAVMSHILLPPAFASPSGYSSSSSTSSSPSERGEPARRPSKRRSAAAPEDAQPGASTTSTMAAGAAPAASDGNQQQQQGSATTTGAWQCEAADVELRCQVVSQLVRHMYSRRPEPLGPGMSHRFTALITAMEEKLYRSAPSREQYIDRDSLAARVAALARGEVRRVLAAGASARPAAPASPAAAPAAAAGVAAVNTAPQLRGQLYALYNQQQQQRRAAVTPLV